MDWRKLDPTTDGPWTVPQAIICGLELAVLAVLIFIGLVSK